MSDPQQPELRRSGRGDVTQEGRRESREPDDAADRDRGANRTVPPENRPGHHPDEEEDKPKTPPG